jgi:hypothetical protein
MTKEETHSGFAEVITVCSHRVRGHAHVVKHTLEFDRKLEAAFYFELGNHVSFRIIVDRSVVKDALRQMSLIISFEYVLLCDEPE